MEIESLVNDFLEYLEVEKDRSPLTIRDYRQQLRRFTDWLHANSDVTTPDGVNMDVVRRYRLWLAHENGTALSKATQSGYVITLRVFLRYLITQRDIATLSPDKIELPKLSAPSVSFLTRDQVWQLLKSASPGCRPGHLNRARLRDRAILETLYSTGLRVSELVSLNRDQIDFSTMEFGVRGKGGKLRVVFLSRAAAFWITQYLRIRQDNAKPLFISYRGGGKRCRSPNTNNGESMRLSARAIDKLVQKYARKCNLPVNVTPHTLRHSFATDLLINGADLRSVQEMLGHASIVTTQRYTHVTNGHLKAVHARFHGHSTY